ncbi:MAG: hypothetical protein WC758_03865 [Candidatus Woesearchaeota archaeon]|jgi:hypothetical protein
MNHNYEEQFSNLKETYTQLFNQLVDDNKPLTAFDKLIFNTKQSINYLAEKMMSQTTTIELQLEIDSELIASLNQNPQTLENLTNSITLTPDQKQYVKEGRKLKEEILHSNPYTSKNEVNLILQQTIYTQLMNKFVKELAYKELNLTR